MTITNLTAKENNGVVVAEFTWGNCKVRVQVQKKRLVEFVEKENLHLFANMNTTTDDLINMLDSSEEWVDNHLADAFSEYWNFNLQEAE